MLGAGLEQRLGIGLTLRLRGVEQHEVGAFPGVQRELGHCGVAVPAGFDSQGQ